MGGWTGFGASQKVGLSRRAWIFRIFEEKKIWIALFICAGVAAAGQNFSSRGPGGLDGMSSLEEAPFRKDLAVSCRFETECFEAEGCAETAFEARLTGLAGGLTPDALAVVSKFSADAGEVELLGTQAGDILSLSGGNIAARHFLTLSRGEARYTVHFSEGPMVVSYLGQCQ